MDTLSEKEHVKKTLELGEREMRRSENPGEKTPSFPCQNGAVRHDAFHSVWIVRRFRNGFEISGDPDALSLMAQPGLSCPAVPEKEKREESGGA